MKNSLKKRMIIGIMMMVAALILQLSSRNSPIFSEWYASVVYPVLVGTIGRVCGIFPWSVMEFALYGLIIFGTIYGVYNIKEYKKLLSAAWLLLAFVALSYTMNCGINYYRKPFSASLQLDMRESSKEELYQLCQKLTDKVNQEEQLVAADHEKSLTRSQTERECVATMKSLGALYPELAGFYPKAKGVSISYILSVQQLSGIYSPFTIEANYNKDMTAYNIPHTICHELSHLKGFMREDEANFVGYLACIQSEWPELRYSGYLCGWIYATNALAKIDREDYEELYRKLNPNVIEDLNANSVFWQQFDGAVAEVSTKINDTYLKANEQLDGIQSYGRVVDLMLAYEREPKK